jgi:prepilin signal peptidase PulO-like enzyme (type II secretory pathway)
VPALAFAAGGALAVVACWRLSTGAARAAGVEIGALPWWLPLCGAAFAAACAVLLGPAAAAPALALAVTTACALCDLRSGYIFDRVTLPALAAVLALGAVDVLPHLYGAALVAALYALPYAATRGRGFGLGDVKLGAVVGAGLGAWPGVVAFSASFIIGAVAGIVLLALGRSRKDAIPFGPFIALGTLAAVIFRPEAPW